MATPPSLALRRAVSAVFDIDLPRPPFSHLDKECLKMNLTYLDIDYDRSAYDAMPRPLKRSFMERLVFSWLYHEHALEGVVLEEEDIWRALQGKPCRGYCDARTQRSLQHMNASIEQILSEQGSREPMTLEWLKGQHAALCDEGCDGAGRYRKRDTTPGVYNLNVTPHASISYYMRKFMDLYERELLHTHPVRAAALAHWEFMKVFPFDAKTGLVGRLMLNAMLIRHDYPPAIIHAEDRHVYFAALDGHSEEMVSVVIDAISSTITAASQYSARYLNSLQQAV